MPRLRLVQNLTDEIRQPLEDLYRHHASFALRQRAPAIRLNAKGFTIPPLHDIFGVDRDTVSAWITRFEQFGIDGLRDAPRSGRPPIYTEDEVHQLQTLIDAEPRQIKQAQAHLEQATGKTSSTATRQRAVKKTALRVAALPPVSEAPARFHRVRSGSRTPAGLTANGGSQA